MAKKISFWIVTMAVLVFILSPLLWIYLTAFKANADIFDPRLIKFVFFKPTLENFRSLFSQYPFWRNLLNTAIVSLFSSVITMLIAFPAAYSFARWNTGGGTLLFFTISTRMFPPAVAAIPHFLVFKEMGLLDTHIGLMLLYVFLNVSFATFLLYGFFGSVPRELEQAAMIDGYDRWQVFRKIVFPLMKPALAVTFAFCLIWSWNEFFFAFLFTRNVARPVNVLISSFWGGLQVQYGLMTAGAAITILPALILVWFLQRYIIQGLTLGAVKG
ncbi:MetI-like domain [Moorella glycerini]|uniref:Trehalose transport system permease protein SugB n=1 Tax=Neomoorella stamsii TaxID=1266720 RepID=A0A9X7P7B6_9FIRM|nr:MULTISPECIES: carbohydrate ABC transporter permease [Moorella]PRR76452.1 Trehalose transport system permease protein SugB [Moorella stamsii]CEP66979.1 MetI-like domain [Moorella glycerini]